MGADDVAIRLKLQDQARVSKGLKTTGDDAATLGRKVRGVGDDGAAMGRGLNTAGQHMDDARKKSGGLKAALGGVKSTMLGVGAGAVGLLGVGAAVGSIVGEYQEAAKAGAQTSAVIKSTGGVAGVTRGHVEDLAGSISNVAGIDDEAIQQGENLLLTFTKLRNGVGKGNDVFDQATQASTDMGVALGTTTASAAMTLGKALQDPAKGYSRLMRSGVSFTDSQIKQIKTLQASGDALGAQKIILAEVRKEFGGSAAAQATPLDKLKVSAGNLAEALGTALAPAATKGVAALAGLVASAGATVGGLARIGSEGGVGAVVAAIDHMIGAGGLLSGTFRVVGGTIGFVASNFGTLAMIVGPLAAGFIAYRAVVFALAAPQMVAAAATGAMTTAQLGLNAAMALNPIALVVGALVLLGAGLYITYQRSETFRGAVQAVWGFLSSNWPLLASIIAPPFAPLIYIARHFDDVKDAASDAWGTVKSGADEVGDAVQYVIDKVNDLIGKMQSVTSLPGKVGDAVGGAAGAVGGLFGMRAEGGPINRTGPYLVGEKGPEVVVPRAGSYVVPNHALPRVAAPTLSSGGGGSGPAASAGGGGGEHVVYLLLSPDGKRVIGEMIDDRDDRRDARL